MLGSNLDRSQIDPGSRCESVHIRLDRSKTLRSSSVYIQIAFDLDRSQIDLSHTECERPLVI